MKRHENNGRAAFGAKILAFILGGPQKKRRGQRGVFVPIRHILCKTVTVLRTALFRVVMQRVVVTNYHYPLRNIPEEHNFHLLRGESLKSRKLQFCFPL